MDPNIGDRKKLKKAATLTVRLTQATRDALGAEAEAEGRSVSEVTERWLDEVRAGRAGLVEVLGGLSVAPAIKNMITHAHAVRDELGDPAETMRANAALKHGWESIIGLRLRSAEEEEILRRLSQRADDVRARCADLAQAVIALGRRDPESEAYRIANATRPSPQMEGLLGSYALAAEPEDSPARLAPIDVLLTASKPISYGETKDVQDSADAIRAQLGPVLDMLEGTGDALAEDVAEVRRAMEADRSARARYWTAKAEAEAEGRRIGRKALGLPLTPKSEEL